MQRHHQRRRPSAGRQVRGQPVRPLAQDGKRALAGGEQPRMAVEGNPRLEHRRIIRRLIPCERQIGATQCLERAEHIRPTTVPGRGERHGEPLEPTQRHLGQQCLGVAEMPVRRTRTDPRQPRRFGDREARGTLFGDQRQRRLDQRLAQVAVVIAAPLETATGPAHVREFYIAWQRTPAARV
jgi:hypothetical protein